MTTPSQNASYSIKPERNRFDGKDASKYYEWKEKMLVFASMIGHYEALTQDIEVVTKTEIATGTKLG